MSMTGFRVMVIAIAVTTQTCALRKPPPAMAETAVVLGLDLDDSLPFCVESASGYACGWTVGEVRTFFHQLRRAE